jgi:putative endonuclease
VEASRSHLVLGRLGEDAALAGYVGAGYRLVARNWRCRFGEIDLVLSKDGVLVFCEVKARRGSEMGGPFEAVTWAKQRKLRALAGAFLAEASWDEEGVRFDVASVSVGRGGRPSVHLFQDAF